LFALPSADREISRADRLGLAHDLFENSKTDRRWDAALQSYLAARAITGDIRTENRSADAAKLAALDSALEAVATYLGNTSFSGPPPAARPPTPYDSPTSFNPKSSSYADLVKPVLDTLKQLGASTTAR